MNLTKNFKIQRYIKLIISIIIGIFSLKLVNTTSNNITEILNSPENMNSNTQFQDIQAKYDKRNNQIVIDGITYELNNPNIILEEEAGYKKMSTNEIMFALINILSKLKK